MRLRHALLATAIAAGAFVGAPVRATAQGTPGYLVIVNAANSASTLPRGEVAALFLKQVTTWPDGTPVAVVDLGDRSPVRAAFSRSVIGRPVQAVRNYWQQQVFGGRSVPPTQRASDVEVVAYVRENPNAIGYVAPSTPLGQGIRPLTIVGK
jgi:ABC-type phosphate transport system substrate-binding protein